MKTSSCQLTKYLVFFIIDEVLIIVASKTTGVDLPTFLLASWVQIGCDH